MIQQQGRAEVQEQESNGTEMQEQGGPGAGCDIAAIGSRASVGSCATVDSRVEAAVGE